MNYFSPGLRELSRKFGRQINRLRRIAARRRLAKAEAELGLLGWQQADYDAETQREVEKIQNCEREQSRMTNESAELGRELRTLVEQRDAARKQYETSRRRLLTWQREISEPLEKMEKQLAALRRQEPTYERRIPELDRELNAVNTLYTEVLTATHQTPQMREELMRLRERTVQIPNEKADLRTQHLRVVSEMRTLETSVAQSRERFAALEKELQELDPAFTAQDRDAAIAIRIKEREKAHVEKEIDTLEGAKSNPYQQIGRVLADNNLAPMNQPQSLEKVRRHRFAVEELEYNHARSLQVSAEDDKNLVRISYLVWAAMAAAATLLGAVVLNG